MKKIIIPIGLFLLGKWVFNKVSIATNIDWQIVDVSFRGGFTNSLMIVSIKLINKTNNSITVDNIGGDFFVNKQNLGYAQTTQPILINSNGIAYTDIGVQLKNYNVVTTLLNLIRNKTFVLTFVGTLKAYNIDFPINYTYNG